MRKKAVWKRDKRGITVFYGSTFMAYAEERGIKAVSLIS
jgi:hypothetical protein